MQDRAYIKNYCAWHTERPGLSQVDILFVKEPSGLSRKGGKRPDGATLVPWRTGKSALWNVTVISTLASCYIAYLSQCTGKVVELVSARKEVKYDEFSRSPIFVPLAFESLGSACSQGLSFLCERGRRMISVTGDERKTCILFQHFSVAIQHFNCILFKASFSEECHDCFVC